MKIVKFYSNIKYRSVMFLSILILLLNLTMTINLNNIKVNYSFYLKDCPVISNCNNINKNCKCIECGSGYITNKDMNICLKTIKNCLSVDLETGKCLKCEDDVKFFLMKTTGECISKIDNCEIYDEIKGICTQCQEGFFLEDPYTCNSYIKGCYVYTKIEPIKTIKNNNTSSKGVFSRKNYASNKDGKITVCEKCADGMILSENKNNCFSIVSHCVDFDKISGKCNLCSENFIINVNNSICFHKINYCEEYDTTSLVCVKCISGFLLSKTKEECFQNRPDCIQQNIVTGECEVCSYLNPSSELGLGFHLYMGSCYPDI
jgi:hypothetical protein